jgi:hypothetical protein
MIMSSVRRIGLLAAIKKTYRSDKKGKPDRPVDESLKHEQSLLESAINKSQQSMASKPTSAILF